MSVRFVVLAVVALLVPAAVAGAAVSTEVVVDYDPALGQLPEGVAVDKRGDVFLSLAPLGPPSTRTRLPCGVSIRMASPCPTSRTVTVSR